MADSPNAYVHIDLIPYGEGKSKLRTVYNGSEKEVAFLLANAISDMARTLKTPLLGLLEEIGLMAIMLEHTNDEHPVIASSGCVFDMGAIKEATEKMKGESNGT